MPFHCHLSFPPSTQDSRAPHLGDLKSYTAQPRGHLRHAAVPHTRLRSVLPPPKEKGGTVHRAALPSPDAHRLVGGLPVSGALEVEPHQSPVYLLQNLPSACGSRAGTRGHRARGLGVSPASWTGPHLLAFNLAISRSSAKTLLLGGGHGG